MQQIVIKEWGSYGHGKAYALFSPTFSSSVKDRRPLERESPPYVSFDLLHRVGVSTLSFGTVAVFSLGKQVSSSVALPGHPPKCEVIRYSSLPCNATHPSNSGRLSSGVSVEYRDSTQW